MKYTKYFCVLKIAGVYPRGRGDADGRRGRVECEGRLRPPHDLFEAPKNDGTPRPRNHHRTTANTPHLLWLSAVSAFLGGRRGRNRQGARPTPPHQERGTTPGLSFYGSSTGEPQQERRSPRDHTTAKNPNNVGAGGPHAWVGWAPLIKT